MLEWLFILNCLIFLMNNGVNCFNDIGKDNALMQWKYLQDFCSKEMNAQFGIYGGKLGAKLKVGNCFCDSKSSNFQDGYPGYRQKDYNQGLQSLLDIENNTNYACLQPLGDRQQFTLYMQSTCLNNWKINEIKYLCENNNHETPLVQIPVHSNRNGVIYKNIFCAMCNNETLKHLKIWQLYSKCKGLHKRKDIKIRIFSNSNIHFNETDEQWILTLNGLNNHTCILSTKPPPKLKTKTHYCKQVINNCAPNWTHVHISEMCQNFTAYRFHTVERRKIIIYRNIFCAMCNYIKITELSCIDPNINLHRNRLKQSLVLKDLKPKLFHFSECLRDEMHDPFTNRCHYIGTNYVNRRFPRSIPALNSSSCQIKTYTNFQYELHNDFAYISEIKKAFLEGNYIIDEYTRNISVCVPIAMDNSPNKTSYTVLKRIKGFCINVKLFHWEYNITQNDNITKIINTKDDGTLIENKDFFWNDNNNLVYCRTVDIIYTVQGPNTSCWQISLPPWSYIKDNNLKDNDLGKTSIYVEMINKFYNPDKYIIDEKGNPAICLSTDFPSISSNKTCTNLVIPKNQIEIMGNQIYVSIFKRNYSASQYTTDKLKNYWVCIERQNPCNTIPLAPEDFDVFQNQSIFVHTLNKIYNTEDYQQVSGQVLICLPPDYTYEIIEPQFTEIEGYMTIVGLSISTICLILHLMAFFLMPDSKNLPRQNLASLAFSLLIAQLLWLLHPFTKNVKTICTSISIAGHFMYLASFSWMGVIAFDVWRKFTQQQMQNLSRLQERMRFIKYSFFGWSLPFVVVLTSVVMDYMAPASKFLPQYSKCRSLISQREALLVFLNIPLTVVLVLNFFFFLVTVWKLIPEICQSRTIRRQETHNVCIYFKLVVIMGLTWMVGFILMSPLNPINWIQYIFIVLNSLQGVFIFFSFTFSKKVRNSLHETFAKFSVRHQLSNSSSMRSDETGLSTRHTLSTMTNSNPVTSSDIRGAQV